MYRLQNQVVLVDGAARSALLDLAGARLHRIPHNVARQFVEGVVDGALPDEATQRWLDRLATDGYLATDLPPLWQRYRSFGGTPFTPGFHTLAVSGDLTRERLLEWLAGTTVAIRHIVVQVDSGRRDEALALAQCLAKRCHCAGYEVIWRQDAQERADIFRRDGQRIGVKQFLPLGDRIRDKLVIDYRTASLLANGSEAAGYVFIDRHQFIKPHRDETTVVYGAMKTHSLDDVVSGDVFHAVARNSKSVRKTCRDCEFRLACLHSFVDREDAEDIASAPRSCRYDPYSADSQSRLC